MKAIEQKILQFIRKQNLIENNDRVLVALSGGPDSVFALHFLCRYKSKLNIEIGAFHLNHSLRGKESDADESFCKHLCRELSVPFTSSKVNVKASAKRKNTSIEEAARNIRYKKLNEAAEKGKYSKIVTAHNLDDNAETVLLNLFHGTGLSGISGIPYQRDKIIRPFLVVSKSEILKELHKEKINFRIDSSNESDDYRRNIIRNQILPIVKEKINPSVFETIFKSSDLFKGYSQKIYNFAEDVSGNYVKISSGKIVFKTNLFENLGRLIGIEILKKELKKKFSFDFSFDDGNKLIELTEKQKGRKILLSGNLEAFRERDEIVIRKREESDDIREYKIIPPAEIQMGNKKINIRNVTENGEIKLNGKKYEYISGDNTDNIFILRRWKSGDKFIPLGMKGYKKISDFLSEQRVPASEKKKQLVLLNRNQVVWVVGLRIDNRYKIIENTKKVYKLWAN